jgi:hypothetical protein
MKIVFEFKHYVFYKKEGGIMKNNMVLGLGVIVLVGTAFVVGTGVVTKQEQSDCVASLKATFDATSTQKSVIRHEDGGLIMLTPAATSRIKMTGFMSPVQLKNLQKNMQNNNLTLHSVTETGKCLHKESGFVYTTFEGEYSINTNKL